MKETVVSSLSSVMLLLFLFLLPCVNAFWQYAQSSPWPLNASDQQSLLAFKSAIEFDPNNSLINWTPNVTFCKWAGITCTPHSHMRRVMKLNLSRMGLEGTISPLLGNLSALQSLDLSNNSLHGHIPPQLGQLSNAKQLLFVGNQLEGTIPASFGGCKNAVHLAFTDNRLQGSIPAELSVLTHLEILHLDRNSLTGNMDLCLKLTYR